MTPPATLHPFAKQVPNVRSLNLAFNNLASLQGLTALTVLEVSGSVGKVGCGCRRGSRGTGKASRGPPKAASSHPKKVYIPRASPSVAWERQS